MTPTFKIPKQSLFESFIEQSLSIKEFSIEPLAGDVSMRQYYRVHTEDQSWVLMDWEPVSNLESFPFLSIQKYLAEKYINVPEIYNINPKEGFFLIEDLGDLTLERKFWELYNPVNVMPYYHAAIDQLCKLHRLIFQGDPKDSCSAYSIQFDNEKFIWEMNYTRKNLLQGLSHIELTDNEEKQLQEEFKDISKQLTQLPQVICHRDYHSRNIMLKREKVYMIDFQDARLGPPQYDLVSLLHDSYIKTSIETVNSYIDYYLDKMPEVANQFSSKDEFVQFFELQTIQRCFKACGTFSFVYLDRGDQRYLRYLPRTIKKVKKALSKFNKYPLMAELMEKVKVPEEKSL